MFNVLLMLPNEAHFIKLTFFFPSVPHNDSS